MKKRDLDKSKKTNWINKADLERIHVTKILPINKEKRNTKSSIAWGSKSDAKKENATSIGKRRPPMFKMDLKPKCLAR